MGLKENVVGVRIFEACWGKQYLAGVPRNASGVSRGSAKQYVAVVPRNASGVSRGRAKCMDGNSGSIRVLGCVVNVYVTSKVNR